MKLHFETTFIVRAALHCGGIIVFKENQLHVPDFIQRRGGAGREAELLAVLPDRVRRRQSGKWNQRGAFKSATLEGPPRAA